MTVEELALEEYHARNIQLRPMYPAVLVRVLPKRRVSSGGIILPEETQSKPVYEGIVVRSYDPKIVKINNRFVTMESGLKQGDHVLFPHWSGEPVPLLEDTASTSNDLQKYRMIPATGAISLAGNKGSGEIFCTLDYIKESVTKRLDDIIRNQIQARIHPDEINRIIDDITDKIKDQFDITVKVTTSELI